jgi:hypothetical protein
MALRIATLIIAIASSLHAQHEEIFSPLSASLTPRKALAECGR